MRGREHARTRGGRDEKQDQGDTTTVSHQGQGKVGGGVDNTSTRHLDRMDYTYRPSRGNVHKDPRGGGSWDSSRSTVRGTKATRLEGCH